MTLKKKVLVIITLFATLMFIPLIFSGCGESALDAPENIEYDGAVITWGKVDNAEYYYISINDGEKKRTNTNSYAYVANLQDFSVEVYAVKDKDEKSTEMSFSALQTIDVLNVTNDGTLYWDEIPGANAYVVSLNGAKKSAVVDSCEYMPQAGSDYRIRVRPIVNGNSSFYSVFGAEKNVFINVAPSNLRIEDNQITWGGSATQYQLYINGEDKGVVYGNSYSLGDTKGKIDIEVYAIGNHTTKFDSQKTKETYKFLESITNFQVENGILNWSPVEEAEGYQLKINNVVIQNRVNTNKYEDLTAGEQLRICVRPWASGKFYSQWSDEQDIVILKAPILKWDSSINLDGEARNNLSWDSVGDLASGYEVQVEKDGSATSYPLTTESFNFAFGDEGEYSVKVKAKAKTGNEGYVYYDSKYSTTATIIRLSAPKANTTDFITSNHDDVTKGFRINYLPVQNATGYQLFLDTAKVEGAYSTNNTINVRSVGDATKTNEQKYNYLVKSVGSVKNFNGKLFVTLDSLSSKSLSVEITVLASPSDLAMDAGSTIANWSDVSNANDYIVNYEGNSFITRTSQYDLAGVSAGSHNVKVCARGNGGAVLPSFYTNTIEIYKMNAPYDLKITRESNYALSFEKDMHATGYKVFLDTQTEALSEESASNIYNFITTKGTNITVQSTANYLDDATKIYYMNSDKSQGKMFTKLLAPKFTENSIRNSDLLTWEAPSNLSTTRYTPTYDVYCGNVSQGNVNSNKFVISNLKGSKVKYAFTVRAIGGNVNEQSAFVDSEFSDKIEFYKLETPTISVANDLYNWGYIVNASAYQIRIDNALVNDQKVVAGKTEYSYSPSFSTVGTHEVKLIAVGDGITSVNSSPFVLSQQVAKLLAPEFTYHYTADAFVAGEKIVVDIKSAIPNCKKYEYSIAGERIVSSDLSCSKTIQSAGTYNISVVALGGVFDGNNVYYINSVVSGGTDTKLVLLGNPSLSTFKLNAYGQISWQAVNGSLGFEYQIAFNDGDYSIISTTSSASIDPIDGYKNYSKITIKVRAKGNGTNVVSSEWVEWSWINTAV